MTLAVVGLIAAFVWAYLSTQALFAPPSRPWLPAAGRLTPGVTLWKVWSGTGNAATRVGTFLRLTVRQDSPYDPSWYALELWNPQEGRFYLPQTTFQDSKEYYVREDDPALPKK
ncbi:MAG: hypothetical protein FJX77_00055 [Armatimonadetes bacterium]|nr:hypothetical protein [Armatimonadota bacterium]